MERAGYLGPAGTVSHEALLASGATVEPVALATLRDVVLSVQNGRVSMALVPVENSLEGGVDPVLDTLALEAPDVVLVAELVHPVSYCLAAGRMLAFEAISTVISHPQATAQCARFLREELPDASLVAAASTADAVRQVAGQPLANYAALGTRFAARRYGARILAEAVEDEPGNATRFAWLATRSAAARAPSTPTGPARPGAGRAPSTPTAPARPGAARAPSTPPGGRSGPPRRAGAPRAGTSSGPRGAGAPTPRIKTALVFWGAGSSSPGWLVACLSPFAARGINLTRIESRPLRRGLGSYMFFLDLEGAVDSEPVAEALAELRRHAEVVRVLGSFPAA